MRISILIAASAAALALAACETVPTSAPVTSFTPTASLPTGVTTREARWFSEQVSVAGRLFLPAGYSATAKKPAVILAPGWGETAESLDAYAIAIAQSGFVAMTVDYRGWGRSGAQVYLGERVDTYDKQRFSYHTPELVLRRGRQDPEHQVQDIRNAITFLQAEAGVDATKIGVMGVGVSGGHVVSVMGMDARAKAGVAVTPAIDGANVKKESYIPSPASQAELVKLAREGKPPRTAGETRSRNALEARLALEDYHPFWRIDAIPQTAALRFIVAGADDKIDNASNALAAAKALKAKSDVQTLDGAKHKLSAGQQGDAARLAAEWFKGNL